MQMKSMVAVALMALIGPTTALGADRFVASGMEMIRKDLGSNCPATLKGVGQALVGNNGLREEQWFVDSCQGVVEYWVSYYPPEAFPHRATHLDVHRVPTRGL